MRRRSELSIGAIRADDQGLQVRVPARSCAWVAHLVPGPGKYNRHRSMCLCPCLPPSLLLSPRRNSVFKKKRLMERKEEKMLMERETWKEGNGNLRWPSDVGVACQRRPRGKRWTQRHASHHSAPASKSGKSKLPEKWAGRALNADASEQGSPVTGENFQRWSASQPSWPGCSPLPNRFPGGSHHSHSEGRSL